MIDRRLWLVALFFISTACVSKPAPHPRALENNEICAQFLSMGDLGKAEVHCDLGLEFSPRYADLWVNKGIIYMRRGQEDNAKDCFIKALRENQDQAQAYNNLGVIYLHNREHGKAHDSFQRALKVNPDYIEARHNLGLTFMRLQEKQKARKEFETLLAVNFNLAEPHFNLGLLDLEDKKIEPAIGHFFAAVQLDPRYDEAWLNLGVAFAEAGKYLEAKDAFTSCIDANPNNAQCRSNLTIVARKAALLDPALKEQKDFQAAENTPASMYLLGKSYRQRGLRNEEERTFRKCLKMDSRYAPCHWGLFEIFRDERRDQEAKTACRNFMKFGSEEEFPQEVDACKTYLAPRN